MKSGVSFIGALGWITLKSSCKVQRFRQLIVFLAVLSEKALQADLVFQPTPKILHIMSFASRYGIYKVTCCLVSFDIF